MSPIPQGVHNSIHHPPVQKHLRHVVNDHGFGEEQLHIVPRCQVGIRDVFEGGETDEVKHREDEGHHVGVHGRGEGGGGIAIGEGVVGPEREEAQEDGGCGVAC